MTFDKHESITRYRDATARQKSMPGVTNLTFTCRACRQCKGTTGRKMLVKGYPKAGYVCAECAKNR